MGLINAQSQYARALGADADARMALSEADLIFRREIHKELSEIDQQLDRLADHRAELAARRTRLELRAPVAGIIQSAVSPTPGQVIAPGERLFEILPTTERLVAELRLAPTDIGHVHQGARATLKPTTYDTRRYGALEGEISTISPTSLQDERGRPYFLAEVALDETVLGRGQMRGEVGAGMIVIAEIPTGQRSVLDYLLKPVSQSLGRSMTER